MITAAIESAQRNRCSLFVEAGELLHTKSFADDQYIMRIRTPKCAAVARPGTFVHLTCDEALPMRRPLSIMRASDDWIEVLYKVIGEGLQLLATKQPGDNISVLGPIGRPFEVSAGRPNTLLLGGGVGIPPIVFLAQSLILDERQWQPLAILGSEIPFPFDLQPSALPARWVGPDVVSAMPLLEGWGIPSRLASLSGFDGCYRGYVTDLAERWLQCLDENQLAQTNVFACGPTPMLRAVAELAGRYSVPCQVSIEEFMACAVGGCAGCTVEVMTPDGPAMKRVCVDGPVFDAATIVWR